MLQLLYDYFYGLFQLNGDWYLTDFQIDLFGLTINLSEYLSLLASLIMLVAIFVCCLVFIWKIIKVVGRLFTGS